MAKEHDVSSFDDTVLMKRCKGCGRNKPETMFKWSKRNPKYRGTYCNNRACRKLNPESVTPNRRSVAETSEHPEFVNWNEDAIYC